MTDRPHWGRLLAEGIVVVSSILLAFAIDAGWDQRQLLQEEREVLRSVAQELEEVRSVIREARNETIVARTRLQFFLSATPAEVAAIPASAAADEVYFPLIRQWGEAIPRGALDAAVNSGQLAGVRDPGVKAALARLGSRHDNVDEIRRIIGDLDIRTAAVLGESEGVRWVSPGELEIDAETLQSFRADPRIRGWASAKYGFVGGYLGILQQLQDAVDETLQLLREEVEN